MQIFAYAKSDVNFNVGARSLDRAYSSIRRLLTGYFREADQLLVFGAGDVGKECANPDVAKDQAQPASSLHQVLALKIVNGLSGITLDQVVQQRDFFSFVCAAVVMRYENDVSDALHFDNALDQAIGSLR